MLRHPEERSICVNTGVCDVTIYYVRAGLNIVLTCKSGPAVTVGTEDGTVKIYMTNGSITNVCGSYWSGKNWLEIETVSIANDVANIITRYSNRRRYGESWFDTDKLASDITAAAKHIIRNPTSSKDQVISLAKLITRLCCH